MSIFAAAARAFARAGVLRAAVLRAAVLLAAGLLVAGAAFAADDWKIDSDTFEGLRARALGPGVMSGRIACIDGVPGERITLWVGTAGGGVWRSKDNGTTWASVFEGHASSIGAIRVAPGDPKLVWVGTGETWARNSVCYGGGGPGHGPAESGRGLRHDVERAPAGVDVRLRRARLRALQEQRRREDVAQAHEGPARGRPRPHRHLGVARAREPDLCPRRGE